MKVFVAADSSHDQDALSGEDFSFTIPCELVHLPPITCCSAQCGCERSMCGFVSSKATTRFIVRDLDISPEAYIDLLVESLRVGGWVPDAVDRPTATSFAVKHMDLAADLPTETPLCIVGKHVMTRPTRS